MFESLKGLAGLAGIMKDLPRIKARMEEVKQRLGDRRVTVERGGGAVRVTATGLLRIVSVELAPAMEVGIGSATNADDLSSASAMITDAVNEALAQARQLAQSELNAAAEELGLPLSPDALQGLLS